MTQSHLERGEVLPSVKLEAAACDRVWCVRPEEAQRREVNSGCATKKQQ